MNAELVLTVFSIAVGVLALGSAVVIGLRGNALKADIAQLRGSNADLDAELQAVADALREAPALARDHDREAEACPKVTAHREP